MKNMIILLIAAFGGSHVYCQTSRNVSITFNLDLGPELKNVRSVSSIGIRGNKVPLSWDDTYPLKDEDKDGVFSATINFETTDTLFQVKFKYFHDTASWEKSDDRVLATGELLLKLPVDKWNTVAKVNTAAYHDSVASQAFFNTVAGLDSLLFDAYNNCKMETIHALFSEDLEFYHDKNGLSTSKKDMVEAIRNNICGKVRRELLKGSIEVSAIPGYGAVEMGMHRFHNLVEKSTSGYSKFITVWRYKDDRWAITRVISLH